MEEDIVFSWGSVQVCYVSTSSRKSKTFYNSDEQLGVGTQRTKRGVFTKEIGSNWMLKDEKSSDGLRKEKGHFGLRDSRSTGQEE